MTVISTSSRQFRERQKDFFDMVDNGQKVIIKRGRQSYLLTPISDEDLYFTPEMIKRIKDAQQEIIEGKSTTIRTKEDLKAFFDSL